MARGQEQVTHPAVRQNASTNAESAGSQGYTAFIRCGLAQGIRQNIGRKCSGDQRGLNASLREQSIESTMQRSPCHPVYRSTGTHMPQTCGVVQLKASLLICYSKHRPTDIRIVLSAGVQACGGGQAAAVCPAELQCGSAVQGIGCCGDHHRAHGQTSGPPHPPRPGLPPSLAWRAQTCFTRT